MPYNYPVLLPLLDELFKIHRGKPPFEFRKAFAVYVSTMPPYYATVSSLPKDTDERCKYFCY